MNDFDVYFPGLNTTAGEFVANTFGRGKKDLITGEIPGLKQSFGDVVATGLNTSGSVPKTLLVQDLDQQQTRIDPTTGMAQDYNPAGAISLASMSSKNKVPTTSASELEKALQARRGWGYSMAKALSGMPQQQGYGSWLGDFARAFGSAYSAPTDAWVNKELALAKEGRENAKAYKDEDMEALVMSLLG